MRTFRITFAGATKSGGVQEVEATSAYLAVQMATAKFIGFRRPDLPLTDGRCYNVELGVYPISSIEEQIEVPALTQWVSVPLT